jgi:hypothetical protein
VTTRDIHQMRRDAPEMAALIQLTIGCDWGHTIWRNDEAKEPCQEQAVIQVELHTPGVGGPGVVHKLCAVHHAMIDTMTDPHND